MGGGKGREKGMEEVGRGESDNSLILSPCGLFQL